MTRAIDNRAGVQATRTNEPDVDWSECGGVGKGACHGTLIGANDALYAVAA